MFKKFLKWLGDHRGCATGIIFGLVFTIGYGLSWLLTCALIKLITLCFGWTFSWSIATGIWLLICLARSIFTHTITVNK